MIAALLSCSMLTSQVVKEDCRTYVLTSNGASDPIQVVSQSYDTDVLGKNQAIFVKRGYNGSFAATNGMVFSYLHFYHGTYGTVSKISIPGRSHAYSASSSVPEGLLYAHNFENSSPYLSLVERSGKSNVKFPRPSHDSTTLRLVHTYSAQQPCIVLAPHNGGLAETYLYDTGRWVHLTTGTTGPHFYPFGVSKSGIVIGGTYKPIGNDFEEIAEVDRPAIQSPSLSSVRSFRPAYWQEGKLRTLPLPKALEKQAKLSPVGMRLLLESDGNFLAHYQGTSNRKSEQGYWLYQNKTWIDLTSKYGQELPDFIIADYDLNTGRILLANTDRYKILHL